MSAGDLEDLYRELIVDHSKSPRNFRVPEGANRKADGYNPLCGDRLTVHLVMDGDEVKEVGFVGAGCAISTAAASTMTEAVKGKGRAEIEQLFHTFHEVLTGHATPESEEALGKLAAFSGVSAFPLRVKCATLAWHTLQAALADKGEQVTTE